MLLFRMGFAIYGFPGPLNLFLYGVGEMSLLDVLSDEKLTSVEFESHPLKEGQTHVPDTLASIYYDGGEYGNLLLALEEEVHADPKVLKENKGGTGGGEKRTRDSYFRAKVVSLKEEGDHVKVPHFSSPMKTMDDTLDTQAKGLREVRVDIGKQNLNEDMHVGIEQGVGDDVEYGK
ncbi:hypothetical protein L1987_32188 [Smallanthus sonchifolius]|uniref:Uncharacterized protein n=1 Tax=Smallanthus sonchifolius TaxID=185202 RepID=A0ACB9I9I9_9ASTR|nr:hypothetical protein L1987_32188 [Smallanthus sonchifolius]